MSLITGVLQERLDYDCRPKVIDNSLFPNLVNAGREGVVSCFRDTAAAVQRTVDIVQTDDLQTRVAFGKFVMSIP